MKIVAVTACPTGIAHTYMAAEQLERVGEKLGHRVMVETQGAMGIENALTPADLAGAEAAILAADIPVMGRDRFKDIPIVLEVAVQQAIKNPVAVFERLKA